MSDKTVVEISVIIPSYNQIGTIGRCINSLLKQRTDKTFEIIVVDSSTEKIQKEIEKICLIDPKVRLLKEPNQTFPGAARNIGIKAALGTIIALIDSDCLADEFWLANIWAQMQDDMVLSGVIQNGTKKNVLGTCSYLIEFNHFVDFNQASEEISAAATCNFACKKEIFDRYGYFSNRRAFEDFFFCDLLSKNGVKILRKKNISVTHLNRTSLNDICANQQMLGKYSALVRKENGLPPQIIFKMPIFAFALIAFRYLSISTRLYNKKEGMKFLLYTPVIMYILFYWAFGFFTGAKQKN